MEGSRRSWKKTKAGGSLTHRLFRRSKLASQLRKCLNLQIRAFVSKCATVLAAGFEPTRAFAQQLAKLLRLPISARQHQTGRKFGIPSQDLDFADVPGRTVIDSDGRIQPRHHSDAALVRIFCIER